MLRSFLCKTKILSSKIELCDAQKQVICNLKHTIMFNLSSSLHLSLICNLILFCCGYVSLARCVCLVRPRAIVCLCFHLYDSLSNIIVFWLVESLRRSVSAARRSPQTGIWDFWQSAAHDTTALANALFEQWARSSIDMKGIYKLVFAHNCFKRLSSQEY